jgi:hypothetical protein
MSEEQKNNPENKTTHTTLIVKILAGLHQAECIAPSPSKFLGKKFKVQNPEFKCHEMYGQFPSKEMEATLSEENNTTIELTKSTRPFSTY